MYVCMWVKSLRVHKAPPSLKYTHKLSITCITVGHHGVLSEEFCHTAAAWLEPVTRADLFDI